METYKSVVAQRLGPPEMLEVREFPLLPPRPGYVRIKVLAASVSQPDVTVRRGDTLYRGTPLGRKPPFVPGYAVIGTVDAVGSGVASATVGDRVGALTVVGGYTEYLYWRADRLIPAPKTLDPAEAVTLILNYVVAYQTMHRSTRVKAGDIVLIIGASGGVGTALLQLGELAKLKMYGVASGSKQAVLVEHSTTPIDYRTQDFVDVIRAAEPDGIDAVFDGMSGDSVARGISVLRRGGTLVSFGDPGKLPALVRLLGTMLKTNLLPNGKSVKFYGTSSYFLGNRQPFLDDWATLFRLLLDGKIKPVITRRFSLLDACQANALLESGQVVGNVVLVAPELLAPANIPT